LPIVALVGLVVVAAGVTAWMLWRTAEPADGTAAATALATPPPADAPGGAPPVAVVAPGLDDRETMLRLDLPRRHELLARSGVTAAELPLHVGLDLVQSEQADAPCATFEAALTAIETAPDREVFAWALTAARPPRARGASESATACDGLPDRLATLANPPGDPPLEIDPEPDGSGSPDGPTPPAGADKARKKSSSAAASSKPTKSGKAAKPAPTPATPTPGKGSIATKLDEELKPMGGP
jgi:hypothetical protein